MAVGVLGGLKLSTSTTIMGDRYGFGGRNFQTSKNSKTLL